MEPGKTRIAVVGCGAMGTIFAGLLASAGNDVIVLVRSARSADEINSSGLRVLGASGDRTAKVRAVAGQTDEKADMVVLAVKAWQVREAAESARSFLHASTVVLAMQNGIGSAELAARVAGADRVAVGIAGGFGASLMGTGHAHHHGMEAIRLGAYAGLSNEQVEHVAAVWRHAGFSAQAVRDIAVMQWEKLICNAAYSPLCALSGLTVGGILNDPDAGMISRGIATEAWRVANAAGIALSVQDPVSHVRAFAEKMPGARPSMMQDVEAGRPSEIDFLNGAVVQAAAKTGISAPLNDMVVRLVKARERGGLMQRGEK